MQERASQVKSCCRAWEERERLVDGRNDHRAIRSVEVCPRTCLADTQFQTTTRPPALIAAAFAPYNVAVCLLTQAIGEAFVTIAAAHAERLDIVAGEVDGGSGEHVWGTDVAVRAIGVEAAGGCYGW